MSKLMKFMVLFAIANGGEVPVQTMREALGLKY